MDWWPVDDKDYKEELLQWHCHSNCVTIIQWMQRHFSNYFHAKSQTGSTADVQEIVHEQQNGNILWGQFKQLAA